MTNYEKLHSGDLYLPGDKGMKKIADEIIK